MLGAMLLSRPKPPQAGAKGQPLQGYSSQRQLPPKVSGPPLAAASTPGRRAESTASACEITHSKFKRAPMEVQELHKHFGIIHQEVGLFSQSRLEMIAKLERRTPARAYIPEPIVGWHIEGFDQLWHITQHLCCVLGEPEAV